MTTNDLTSLIDLCRKHGIRRIKTADVELEFGSEPRVDDGAVKAFADAINNGMPSEEETLFWSTQGFQPEAKQEPEKPKTTRQRRAPNV